MKFILIIFFLIYSLIGVSQYYTSAQINTINNSKTAAEGDMYLDTVNNTYYIGLTSGSLAELNDNTTELIQTGHGLSIPAYGILPLYYNNLTSQYNLAQADTITHEMDIMAINFPDNNTIKTKNSGYITLTHGLSVGTWYYLDPSVSGNIIDEASFSCLNSYSIKQPLFYTVSANKIMLVNERAQVCSSFGDYIDSTVALNEDFDGTSPYTTSGDASINTDAICAYSGTDYLEIGGNNGTYTSSTYDLSGCNSVRFSFYYKEVTGTGCGENNQPEANEGFDVQYFDGSSWVTIFTSNGGDDIFTYTQVSSVISGPLPTNFQFRFAIYAGNNNFDFWNVDDVVITCYN